MDGTVKSHQKLGATSGGMASLETYDSFGNALAGAGDVNGDTIPDVFIAAYGDDDGTCAAHRPDLECVCVFCGYLKTIVFKIILLC